MVRNFRCGYVPTQRSWNTDFSDIHDPVDAEGITKRLRALRRQAMAC
jgi:hypothetical protein